MSSGRNSTKPTRLLEARIAPRVRDRIIDDLRNVDASLVPKGSNKVGSIKDFHSLAPQAQQLGLGIGKLKSHVNSGYYSQIEEAEHEVSALAKEVLARMGFHERLRSAFARFLTCWWAPPAVRLNRPRQGPDSRRRTPGAARPINIAERYWPIILIRQYRFATPNPLQTRPRPGRCETVPFCTLSGYGLRTASVQSQARVRREVHPFRATMCAARLFTGFKPRACASGTRTPREVIDCRP